MADVGKLQNIANGVVISGQNFRIQKNHTKKKVFFCGPLNIHVNVLDKQYDPGGRRRFLEVF